jgi:uncharacterized protein
MLMTEFSCRRTAAALVAGGLMLAAACMDTASAAPRFRSGEEALAQGISAYNGGYYELALPALQSAADTGLPEDAFLARYFLGRIYADNNSNYTNHARAYELFQRLANEYSDVDPDDDRRAPFVAKALIALAEYTRNGLPAIGLQPNPARAADYLQNAATVFGDEDAQFELAKMQLKGDGIDADVNQAKHWLATLSQKGHPGAQAFLADLYWRGKIMTADPVKALALITIAVANAPAHEKVWIEDIYQNIYCGASIGTRKQATGLVADWRTRYGRKSESRDHDGLAPLDAEAVRTCKDGEPVAPYKNGAYRSDEVPPQMAARPAGPPAGFVEGSAAAMPGLRGVGASTLVPAGR